MLTPCEVQLLSLIEDKDKPLSSGDARKFEILWCELYRELDPHDKHRIRNNPLGIEACKLTDRILEILKGQA